MSRTPHTFDPVRRLRENFPVLLVICCLGIAGCATTPYRFGHARAAKPVESSPEDVAFEFGTPRPTMDRMRSVVDFPKRIFHPKAGPPARELSLEHQQQLAQYLSQNDLTDVRVLVNQYDPQGEWRRLKANHRVSPGWRYTAGLFSLAGYTVLPGRVFGHNSYNPYTNSLSVNSDRVASAVYEAAWAKDIHGCPLPGTYATAAQLPGFSVVKSTRAVNDVLGYCRIEDNWELEHQTYHECYPLVASGVIAPAQFFVNPVIGMVMRAGCSVVGHAAGYMAEARRLAERKAAEENEEEDSKIQTVGHWTIK
jgi:hypothetical protein